MPCYPLTLDGRYSEGWLANADQLPACCSQCGKLWRAGACGPTHAAVFAARRRLRHRRGTVPGTANSLELLPAKRKAKLRG